MKHQMLNHSGGSVLIFAGLRHAILRILKTLAAILQNLA